MKKASTYLGLLCPKGHDFEGTGKSLRYSKNQVCVECQRESMRRKSQKYQLEQELASLRQENAELKRQLSIQQNQIWYVALVNKGDIPISANIEAEKLQGKLVLAVDKKPLSNAYAAFAFNDMKSAISFQEKMLGRVLVISNPSTTPQINICDFN